MNLSERNQNIAFWVLQFCGWAFINCLSVFIMKNVSTQLIVYSIFMGIFMGVFSTSLMRAYIKRNVNFESFVFKDLLKITIVFLLTCVLFAAMNMTFGYVYAKFGPGFTDQEIEIFKAFDGLWIQIFNALFIIGSWTVTYLVIKLLLKLNRDRIERLQLSTNLKQAQLNTLKGQINPHFMFNSLNNIRGLMLEDVDRSREMLTKLSEMLRYSLTKNNVNAIAVEEELDMVRNYIALSKIQFEDRLDYIEDVQKDTLQLQIPPMLVQLLVENAAKHGIATLKEGGAIFLGITKVDEVLTILVKNTGKLQIAKNSTQLGLKNIRQRLQLLYGAKATFKLEEHLGEVVAAIKITMS